MSRMSAFEVWLITCPFEVLTRLLSFLSVRRLYVIGRTSKTLKSVLEAYTTIAWDLNRRFKPWFSDIKGFRRALHEANGVVSGSQALQFFDRDYYPDSDMDIFVRAGGVETMSKWLTRHSYTYKDESLSQSNISLKERIFALSARAIESKSNTDRPMLGVFNFTKPKRGKTEKRGVFKVQVIAVDIEPIKYILFEFHSSEYLARLKMKY